MTTKKQAPKGKKSAPAEKKTPASKPATNPFLKQHPANPWRTGNRPTH